MFSVIFTVFYVPIILVKKKKKKKTKQFNYLTYICLITEHG